jgi:hypothetical protein
VAIAPRAAHDRSMGEANDDTLPAAASAPWNRAVRDPSKDHLLKTAHWYPRSANAAPRSLPPVARKKASTRS